MFLGTGVIIAAADPIHPCVPQLRKRKLTHRSSGALHKPQWGRSLPRIQATSCCGGLDCWKARFFNRTFISRRWPSTTFEGVITPSPSRP